MPEAQRSEQESEQESEHDNSLSRPILQSALAIEIPEEHWSDEVNEE